MKNNDFITRFYTLLAEISSSMPIANVADDCEISRTTLYAYLHGVCYPSTMNLWKLADYLNCSLDYLVGRSDDRGAK